MLESCCEMLAHVTPESISAISLVLSAKFFEIQWSAKCQTLV